MGRHIMAPLYVVDALAASILFAILPERAFVLLEVAFIGLCLRSLWHHAHIKFLSLLFLGLVALVRPVPRFFPVLHFMSQTIIAIVLTGERKGSSELLLCHGFSFLFYFFRNAFNTFISGQPALLVLPSFSYDPLLDQYPLVVRFVVPFAVAWVGVLKLFDGDKKVRRPWIWHQVASLRVRMPQKTPTLQYKVRFVQNHLVGLELAVPPACLQVKVDAVEWVQVWLEGSLLIIYGLTPQVDYLVQLIDEQGTQCHLIVSTFVPGTETHAGVRRQTPMKTLLEARDIALDTLAEEKIKTKKLRKEQNKTLANLRHEIDALSAKHNRTAKSDERLSRKLMGLQESLRQLNEEIREISAAHAELERDRPESEAAYARREREYTQEMQRLAQEEARLDQALSKVQASLASHKQDLRKLEARQSKQTHRLVKLEQELSAARSSTSSLISQVLAKREKSRRQKYGRRATQQAEFEASIRKLELGVREVQARAQQFEDASSSW